MYVCMAYAQCKCVGWRRMFDVLYHCLPYSRTSLELGGGWQPTSLLVWTTYSTRATDRCEWLFSPSHTGARDLNVGPRADIEGALTS